MSITSSELEIVLLPETFQQMTSNRSKNLYEVTPL